MHKKKYLYINMAPSSIYVISGSNLNPSSYQLKFVGFQYAVKIKDAEIKTLVDMTSLGENPYIAPEALKGNVSEQSDIYSVGKIF